MVQLCSAKFPNANSENISDENVLCCCVLNVRKTWGLFRKARTCRVHSQGVSVYVCWNKMMSDANRLEVVEWASKRRVGRSP